jgi:homoserine dehydrogenase
MLQKEAGEGETQTDLIILTHETKEKQVNRAIDAIEDLSTVAGKVHRIRLEHLG